MKSVLVMVFVVLAFLTGVAMITFPEPPHDNKTHLVRLSDSHPRRAVELSTFNGLYPGLFLTLDPTGGKETDKVVVQATSGVGPDLFDVYNGMYLQAYVESGVAWDITELARQHGCSMDDKTWPAVRGNISYQGRQYSYPANCGVDILIYNKAVFDEMGVPYPTQDMSWDETFALAQRLTRPRGPDGRPYFGLGAADWQAFFESQAGQYFSEDGTRLQLTEGALPKAFEMHRDTIFRYKISPSTVMLKAMSSQGGFGGGEAIAQFADGRFGMIVIGKWSLVNFRAARKDQLELAGNDPVKLAHVIRLGSVHQPHMPGMRPSYRVGAKSTAINALGKNRDKSIAFLSYLAGPEYSAIINEGVDALPGNPAYADYGLKPGVPELSELEMHRNTVESMQYGYILRQSPFLLTQDIVRVMTEQIGRIEADPNLPVSNALAAAKDQLLMLMQRNLDRSPAAGRAV